MRVFKRYFQIIDPKKCELEQLLLLQELLIKPCETMEGVGILSLAKLTQLTRLELNHFPFDGNLDFSTDHTPAGFEDVAEHIMSGLEIAHGEGWQESLLKDEGFQDAVLSGLDNEDSDFLGLVAQRNLLLNRLASLKAFSAGLGESQSLDAEKQTLQALKALCQSSCFALAIFK